MNIAYRCLSRQVHGRTLFDIGELGFEPGRFIALSGPNGAGKTTLLKTLAGLERPDSGLIRIGDSWRPWSKARHFLRANVVYTHQSPYMMDRSVAANVGYGLRRRGVGRRDVEKQVREALEWAGLQHLHDRNARQLSGGEKQRVAITRARVLAPAVLLLDEPTANMDSEGRDNTYFLLKRLKNEAVSLMLATHDLNTANIVADQGVHLENGRLESTEPDSSLSHRKLSTRANR